MHQILFLFRLRAPSQTTLEELKGPTSKGRRRGGEREGGGWEGEGRGGGEGKGQGRRKEGEGRKGKEGRKCSVPPPTFE